MDIARNSATILSGIEGGKRQKLLIIAVLQALIIESCSAFSFNGVPSPKAVQLVGRRTTGNPEGA